MSLCWARQFVQHFIPSLWWTIIEYHSPFGRIGRNCLWQWLRNGQQKLWGSVDLNSISSFIYSGDFATKLDRFINMKKILSFVKGSSFELVESAGSLCMKLPPIERGVRKRSRSPDPYNCSPSRHSFLNNYSSRQKINLPLDFSIWGIDTNEKRQ